MTENLEARLKEFKDWSRKWGTAKGTAFGPGSVPKQVRVVRRFSKIVDVFEMDRDKIMDELIREQDRGIKNQTLNHVIYDLEAWSRFLGKDIRFPRFPEPKGRRNIWLPSNEEVELIRRTARNNPDRAISLRNGVIIDILFSGGIRIGELIRINLGDIDKDGINIRSEKNEEPRKIGLPDQVMKDIEEYVSTYRYRTDSVALFTTKKGRLNYQFARNIVKKIAMSSGVVKFHAHTARHWNATELLRLDVDVSKVQIHLGHSDPRSTMVYTHLRQQEVAGVVRSKMAKFFREGEIITKADSNPTVTEPVHGGTAEISILTLESDSLDLNSEVVQDA